MKLNTTSRRLLGAATAVALLASLPGCARRNAATLGGPANTEIAERVLARREPAPDRDLDGLDAGLEKRLGTNDNRRDTDGDGLDDYAEVTKYRTNPTLADSDGDGQPDGLWSERREFADTLRVRMLVSDSLPVADYSNQFQDILVVAFQDGFAELEIVAYPNARPRFDATSDAQRRVEEPAVANLLRSDATGLRYDQVDAIKKAVAPARSDLERALMALGQIRFEVPNTSVQASYEPFLDVRVRGEKIEWVKGPDYHLAKEHGANGLIERMVYAGTMFERGYVGTSGGASNLAACALRAAGLPARLVAIAPGKIDDTTWWNPGRESSRALFGVEVRIAEQYYLVEAPHRFARSAGEAPGLVLFSFDRFERVDFPTIWQAKDGGKVWRVTNVERVSAQHDAKLPAE